MRGFKMAGINRAIKKILAEACLAAAACLVLFAIWYSDYRRGKANEIVLKSRYTFTIHIDSQGNVLHDENSDEKSHTLAEDFGSLEINEIGDIWAKEFTSQFTDRYLSRSKALRNVIIYDTQILDEKKNIVLVSFSANLKDTTSEYFSSWNGILDDGRLYCEWVVQFDIDDHYDGTATIYVNTIVTPEDYGIAQYNASLENEAGAQAPTEGAQNTLAGYEIRENTLYVTFDGGGHYQAVPVDCDNLMFEEGSESKLAAGSYMISTTKTAFLYGGKTSGGKRVPATLIYSNDSGENWITCEISQIYDVSYYYVEFFGERAGVIVIGYAQREQRESSRIYMTNDGGENWEAAGTGPANNVIKGVKYINENIGFFCYDYADGMDSNLYITRDAGKTFAKVVFEEQELDSTAANSQTAASSENATQDPAAQVEGNGIGSTTKLKWSDVYKEALVPVCDEEGVLTVYLTQGEDGVYNSGKTAAMYKSFDNGSTWRYIGQFEIDLGLRDE